MFRLKRDRNREVKTAVGLDYYSQNGISIRWPELLDSSNKVVKGLAKLGIKATSDEAKLVLRSRYASGNIEKAIELFRYYEDASSGMVLDVQDAPSSTPSQGGSLSPSVSPSLTRSPVIAPAASPAPSESDSNTLSVSSGTATLTPSLSSFQLSPSLSHLSLESGEKNSLMPMKGADNLNNVTCYMDSLLFAMYARLDVFEPLLYKVQEDPAIRNLSTLIRLWVNLLRSGKLITTDITAQLRSAIADCGWPEAGKDLQQDASELFVFITEKLAMPLLTLKMDIAHGGKEVADDDHKFVNERVLHVPIGGSPSDPPLRLEACLEDYFSDSVVVRREIERRRSMSISSLSGKPSGARVEYAEVPEGRIKRSGTIDVRPEVFARGRLGESPSPSSPSLSRFRDFVPDFKGYSLGDESAVSLSSTISHETPIPPESLRSSSIVSALSIPSQRSASITTRPPAVSISSMVSSRRRSTIRTINNEISLPAWTFLQLLPFYTDSTPHTTSAEHFGHKRPVLPICLKRYSWTAAGKAVRNDRKILIPEVIEFPHFVADDEHPDGANDDTLSGKFRLVLESAVCHRGRSLDSGHYVSIVRDSLFRRRQKQMQQQNPDEVSADDASSMTSGPLSGDNWLLFDDMATPKIKSTTFHDAIDKEVPYLLFYRMVHIDEPIQIESKWSSLEPVTSVHSVPTDASSSDDEVIVIDSATEVGSDLTDSYNGLLVPNPSRADLDGRKGGSLGDDLLLTHARSESVMVGDLASRSSLAKERRLEKNRKQSVVSMPGGSTLDPAATDPAHHGHKYHRHRHRLHRRRLGKSESGDDFDEEERCVVS
ncbi:ubiquitin carboxyl-terminal hydrolase-domain-containing protein [Myxozyma melibiosi]|uniref:ubiquitinyl hydrolase 1 n=1 Tax=Myxozyma melibiosi TaxID=54550 RepID=A0ABR1F0M2_9ASCO